MITFAKESLSSELFAEIVPLAQDHFEEVDPMPDKKQGMNFNFYVSVELALRIFTARIDDKLAGYATFFVNKHPHYEDSLQAQQDLVFMVPEHRGLFGLSFLRYCDEELINEGVEAILQHSPVKRDFGPVLGKLGYEPIQTLYIRRVA